MLSEVLANYIFRSDSSRTSLARVLKKPPFSLTFILFALQYPVLFAIPSLSAPAPL